MGHSNLTRRTTRSAAAAAIVGALVTLAAPTPADAKRGDPLKTDAGVFTAGGRVAFELAHVNPDGPAGGETGVLLNFNPTFGGFVARNLLIEGGGGVVVGLGDLYDFYPTVLRFTLGAQYLFNFGMVVVPYLGARFGPALNINDGGPDLAWLNFSVPAGILIPLNENVALNVGTELTVSVGVSDGASTSVLLPMGYLGLSAFF